MDKPIFTNLYVETSRIIYTPSPFARASLVHLHEVGTLKAKKPHISRRSGLSSYLFFIVLSGLGSVAYDGEGRELGPGDCVFIDCQRPYSQSSSDHRDMDPSSPLFGSYDSLWTLKWVHFYGSTMPAVYDKYMERGGCFAFHTVHVDDYVSLIDDIFDIASSASYVRDMEIAVKLMELLTLLMEESWNPGNKRRKVNRKLDVQAVKDYLDHNYMETITLGKLSGLFYIDKFYLAKVFKKQYGLTVNSYILQLRITKAKSLLRFTDKSIEMISAEVGIADSNYFTRAFKKVEGVPPSEYRRSWYTREHKYLPK